MNKELQSYIGLKKVVIEAGHVQAQTSPGVEQQQSIDIALNLMTRFSNVHNTLLIDDRRQQLRSGDITGYLRWLGDHGYKPHTVFLESELFKPAMELYREIKDRYPNDESLTHMPTRGRRCGGGEGVLTPAGPTTLLTPSGEPSVELMDASLYLEKSRLGDVSLTILPDRFGRQQRKTMALLDKVGEKVSVAHVFFQPGKQGVKVRTGK